MPCMSAVMKGRRRICVAIHAESCFRIGKRILVKMPKINRKLMYDMCLRIVEPVFNASSV